MPSAKPKQTDSAQPSSSSSARPTVALVAVCVLLAGLVLPLVLSSKDKQEPADHAGTKIAAEQSQPANDLAASTIGSDTRSQSTPSTPETEIPSVPSTGNVLRQGQRLSKLLDPENTGWQTEAFNEAAGKQLKKLAHALEHPEERKLPTLGKLLAGDFRCSNLKPINAASQLEAPGFSVEQANVNDPSEQPLLDGAEGLLRAIQSLPEPAGEYHVKFKIVGVKSAANQVETPIYAEGGGIATGGRVQWRANWDCVWKRGENSAPRLVSIAVRDYEQLMSPDRPQPWFVDDTHAVLGSEPSYQQQLVQSTDYWIQRVEGRLGISRLGHHGLAVGDVNGDGRDDLYVCQPGGLPNRLYLSRADGTAQDVAASAGVDYLDDSTCALLVDLDNDGDQDLVVVTVSGAVILSNDGRAVFQPQAILPECRNAFSLTAADYDGDRRPDLYVGRYWPDKSSRGDIALPVPYYDAQNGGRNMMLRNSGDWKFIDVTAEVGLDEENTRFTMAAAWDDIDEDGDSDLYVANDFGRNCLYRNDGGKFTNVAAAAGVEDIASGMSVSFADYDHNGLTDIYVSNMFSSAGNRITYQRQFDDRFAGESLQNIQRMARGNTLFQNRGDLTFSDQSLTAAVTMGRWAWGSLFADINNDSWEDLVVLNGFISTADTGDL